MVSASRGAGYDRDQARIVTLALRELEGFWRTIDTTNPAAAKAALLEFMPILVDAYGPISATVAADFYDEVRAAAGIASRFTARPAGAPGAERVAASTSWASQPLFPRREAIYDEFGAVVGYRDIAPDPDAALARLSGMAQRYVQQAGRDTLLQNGSRDPARPRWARRPDGDPCKFCNMLASRGAVYLTAESAGEFNDWHDDCNCQPEMTFDGEVSYDVGAAFQRYLDAA